MLDTCTGLKEKKLIDNDVIYIAADIMIILVVTVTAVLITCGPTSLDEHLKAEHCVCMQQSTIHEFKIRLADLDLYMIATAWTISSVRAQLVNHSGIYYL